jgi:PE-PPE domain-containing protein
VNGLKTLATAGLLGGVASALSIQVAHADDTLLAPLSGSDMAIILGGTTEPTPSLAFAQAAENVYLHALGFDDGATYSTVCDMTGTDPCAAPLQVLTTPELIQQGPSSFTAADDVTLAVENEFNANPHAFDADHPLTIFGYSQSATAESIAMTQINDYSMAHGDSIPLDDLHFVFIGDPSLADTGVWPNLLLDLDSILGTTLTNTILTDAGFDAVLGNVTPDDLYPTTIYSLDGDGVAQFQQDFESGGLLGTIEGLFLQHVEYLGLTPEELALATTTTQGDLTLVDIPDTFNNADAWLSAVFENGAAGSGLLESVIQSLELYLTNMF